MHLCGLGSLTGLLQGIFASLVQHSEKLQLLRGG